MFGNILEIQRSIRELGHFRREAPVKKVFVSKHAVNKIFKNGDEYLFNSFYGWQLSHFDVGVLL